MFFGENDKSVEAIKTENTQNCNSTSTMEPFDELFWMDVMLICTYFGTNITQFSIFCFFLGPSIMVQ